MRRRLRGTGPRGGVAQCPPSPTSAPTRRAVSRANRIGDDIIQLDRDGAQVEQASPFSVRPTTGGRPDRSGTASAAGTLTAALGRVTPGAAPPPTAASEATALASMPSVAQAGRERLRACPQGLHGRLERGPDRWQRAGQGGLEGRQGQLVDPQGAGGRRAAQPFDELGLAEQQARLRPAQQLVTARRDQRAPRAAARWRRPARRAAAGAARAAPTRCRRHRRAEGGQVGDLDARR